MPRGHDVDGHAEGRRCDRLEVVVELSMRRAIGPLCGSTGMFAMGVFQTLSLGTPDSSAAPRHGVLPDATPDVPPIAGNKHRSPATRTGCLAFSSVVSLGFRLRFDSTQPLVAHTMIGGLWLGQTGPTNNFCSPIPIQGRSALRGRRAGRSTIIFRWTRRVALGLVGHCRGLALAHRCGSIPTRRSPQPVPLCNRRR